MKHYLYPKFNTVKSCCCHCEFTGHNVLPTIHCKADLRKRMRFTPTTFEKKLMKLKS
uniref:Uncharacterized protein n=1 Tax=Arion vulgaris TaxID=1028688 RepID=A0A0B7B2M2_9EUPU